MANDIEILRQLENEIATKLKAIKFDDIMFAGSGGTYSVDNNDNIVGLNLAGLELVQFPPSLLKLKCLKRLSMKNTGLSELPKEINQLKNLQEFALTENNLRQLPPEILDLDLRLTVGSGALREKNITLKGNPLESPPFEIIQNGRNALEEYFRSLEGKKQALNEVKVLLVGDGGAGKTSLVKRLIGDKFNSNEPETHGINIRNWGTEANGKKVKLNIWDFGGQEIMHATHQFFLSKRSLYILVLDGRRDEKTEYWLKHIESFGGDSPILIVINKIDQNSAFEVNRKTLLDKYEGIKGFYRVSCATGEGINTFVEGLRNALAYVELLQTIWATNWFQVKTRLENETNDFINYGEYIEICKNENITDESSQKILVEFLNDLGVILHFRDYELLDTHVLDPKWVTEAVYKIINSKELAKNNGVLILNLLDEILKKTKEADYYYPPDRYKYIIDLMKKFELCYEIDIRMALIPDRLGIQEPEFIFDYKSSLRFVIEYDFLPKSIMPRFIIKMHKNIKDNLRWRTGVVIEDKNLESIAVIRSDDEEKKIDIYVNGSQKRDYFAIILYFFREINGGFEKLGFTEKVPMPDNPEVTISYSHLKLLDEKGFIAYIPDGSLREYNVKELLGEVQHDKASLLDSLDSSFAIRRAKKARCTLKNEQRQHNKPAKSAIR